MTHEEMVAFAVLLSTSVGMLVVAYVFVLLPASTALFRQYLFRVRADLFLLAASDRIAFDDPAYVHFRNSINVFLQYAERLSWLRLLFVILCTRAWSEIGREPSLDDLIARLPDQDVRKHMDDLQLEFAVAMMDHFMRTSLPALVLIQVLKLIGRGRQLLARETKRSIEALSHGFA